MKIDFGAARSLQEVVRNDLTVMERLDDQIRALEKASLSEPETVQLAYLLHNAYGALENSFDQISRTFENHVVNRDRWHQELLEKMFNDLSPLRPAVLPAAAKPVLRELLSFRHLFRHAYDFTLDRTKVTDLAHAWSEHSDFVRSALESFAEKLGQVPPA